MPFLVVPAAFVPTDNLAQALAARLCPYRETPRPVLATRDHIVFGTSLVRSAPRGVVPSLEGGTAAFALDDTGDGGLVVATDPLGTCPVWYARVAGGWAAAAEAKALGRIVPLRLRADQDLLRAGARSADWSPFAGVQRLPPGARLRLVGGHACIEGAPRSFAGDRSLDTMHADWPAQLGSVMHSALAPVEGRTAAFVSGGIDSSLACAIARRQGPVTTVSLGTRYGDEFAEARALAEHLDTEHHEVRLEAAQARAELERVVFENEVFDGLTAEILVQMSALVGAVAGTCRRAVTGYGSDLLFDGMLRHQAYMQAVGVQTTAELIERTRWTGELAPFVGWSRQVALAHPFWSEAVITCALAVPRALCFVGGVEKHVLRTAAVRAGLLPEALAFRRKRGLSDGTGANRLVSDLLGIESTHGYEHKTRWCAALLRRLLDAA